MRSVLQFRTGVFGMDEVGDGGGRVHGRAEGVGSGGRGIHVLVSVHLAKLATSSDRWIDSRMSV